MSSRPPGLLLVLVAAVVALVLVPGSMSASDAGSQSSSAATAGDALDIALSHVRTSTTELGVTSADVADLFVTSRYTSRHNGVTHVNLNQRFRDLEVFGGHATVNVAADGRVVFVGGRFVSGLADASGEGELAAAEAVEAAAESLNLDDPANLRVLSREDGAAQETVLSGGGISDEPIPARLGWQPTTNGLRLAWRLVIDDSSASSVWNATVDADNGRLLAVDDWTDHDTREDLASRLQREGGQTSAAVQALAAGPTVFEPANPVNDGSSYRVYPQESPDDSDRVLFTNPADGFASPFGWHDTNGVPGAEFTITRGNNVHAYTDRDNDGVAGPVRLARRRRRARLRLPHQPRRARAVQRAREHHEHVPLVQHRARRHVPVRLRRGVGELPGEQLRPGRHRRRRRPLRGHGRLRPVERELLDPRRGRRAARGCRR